MKTISYVVWSLIYWCVAIIASSKINWLFAWVDDTQVSSGWSTFIAENIADFPLVDGLTLNDKDWWAPREKIKFLETEYSTYFSYFQLFSYKILTAEIYYICEINTGVQFLIFFRVFHHCCEMLRVFSLYNKDIYLSPYQFHLEWLWICELGLSCSDRCDEKWVRDTSMAESKKWLSPKKEIF